MNIRVDHYFHFAGESEILTTLAKLVASSTEIKESIVTLTAQQQAVVDALNAASAAQVKTAAEIVTLQGTVTALQGTVAELETAVANAGAIPDEIVALVQKVKDQAVAIDDQIPDVPAPIETPTA